MTDRLVSGLYTVNHSAPAALQQFRQWIVWRLEELPGAAKPAKMPYCPRTGQRASTVDPATWVSYSEAVAAVQAGGWNGIGFVFSPDDPFGFLDLDSCADAGAWKPHAQAWIAALPGAAWEVSQSGTGLHGVVYCDGEALLNKWRKWRDANGEPVEFYTTGRFMAISGTGWSGEPNFDHTATLVAAIPDRAPGETDTAEEWRDEARPGYSGPANDDELIRRALEDKRAGVRFGGRASFRELWTADAAALATIYPADTDGGGFGFDHSRADQALMNLLAFWTGCNPVRMERLFSLSALGKRDKWQRRPYYRRKTVHSSIRDPERDYLNREAFSEKRRAEQIERNQQIGDDPSEPSVPEVMTLDDMRRRLVFVGASGAVVDSQTMRIRAAAVADREYAASEYVIETGEVDGKGNAKTKTVAALKAWLKLPDRKSVDVVTWAPERPQLCRPPEGSDAGDRAFNTWRGIPAGNVPQNWQEWARPFFDHVAYLVPVEDERERFLQWLAHIVQRPGRLPHTAYLMVTQQTGIGRNALASVLVRVLRGYVAAGVSIRKLLDGSFNGRISKKLLAIVDETREGMTERRYERGERLKSLITEEYRHVNPKYGVESVEYNCCRWLMFSNHYDALPFDNNDRRIIVIKNPSERASAEWYSYIYGLIDNLHFINSVRHFLETYDISGFNPGEHAPMNDAKAQALDAQASEADRAAVAFRQAWPGPLATNRALRRFIAEYAGEQAVPSGVGLHHVMKRAGMLSLDRALRINGTMERVVIVKDLLRDEVKAISPAVVNDMIHDAAAKFYSTD